MVIGFNFGLGSGKPKVGNLLSCPGFGGESFSITIWMRYSTYRYSFYWKFL